MFLWRHFLKTWNSEGPCKVRRIDPLHLWGVFVHVFMYFQVKAMHICDLRGLTYTLVGRICAGFDPLPEIVSEGDIFLNLKMIILMAPLTKNFFEAL